MKTVGFVKAGKDPADRRKQLWTRGAEVRDFTPPCPLMTRFALVTKSEEWKQSIDSSRY
jgi:hypothetical protein